MRRRAQGEQLRAADLQTRLKLSLAITNLLRVFHSPADDRIPASQSRPVKRRRRPDRHPALRAIAECPTARSRFRPPDVLGNESYGRECLRLRARHARPGRSLQVLHRHREGRRFSVACSPLRSVSSPRVSKGNWPSRTVRLLTLMPLLKAHCRPQSAKSNPDRRCVSSGPPGR